MDTTHGGHRNDEPDTDPVPPAALIAELGKNTDLAGLVERVCRSNLPWVVVSESALAAWRERDPAGWKKVSAWLASKKITIVRA